MTDRAPPPLPLAQCIEEMLGGLAAWEMDKRWDAMGITAQVAAGGFDWGWKQS